jgi:DNA-binding transcriptional LysR family regulator
MTSINLRYFAAVARRGSIREAAEELHVAQSALSRQIQKLEQDFGVPLFQRHAPGVEITKSSCVTLAPACARPNESARSWMR